MKKLALMICLLFIGLLLNTHAQQTSLQECNESHLHEMTFLVSNQDLYFDKDDIMVVIGESFYPVKTLEKIGSHWRVKLASAGYCQMGHNLCGGCLLCHKKGCIYYIKPCKLWE